MPAPYLRDLVPTSVGTASTTHDAGLGTRAAGTVYVAFCTYGSGYTTVNTPNGWTLIGTVETVNSGAMAVFARKTDGTEGASVNFSTAAACKGAFQVFSIDGSYWTGNVETFVEIAFGTAGNNQYPDPPNLDPTQWGTEPTFWVAAAGANASTTCDVGPWGNLNSTASGGSGGASTKSTIGSDYTASTASSMNPTAFTFAAAVWTRPATLAVRGTSAISIAPDPATTATDVPAPTLQQIGPAQTLTPSATAAVTDVPAPTVGIAGAPLTLTPTPVAAATATTAQTIGLVKTLSPTPSAAVTANTAVTLGHTLTLTNTPTTVITAVPTVAVDASRYVQPDPLAAATAVPTPTIQIIGPTTNLAPTPTAITASATNVTLTFSKTITPTPPTVTTAIAAPTVGLPTPQGTRRVEVHDPVTHALLDILENAYKVSYDLQVNAAPIASFMLPRDDPKWERIVPFYEVWLYNELNELIDVFRIAPIQERRASDGTIAQVKLEGYACALQDDIIPTELIWTNQTVTTILTDILSYQTTARITLGTIDSSLNKTISTRASFENLMRAAWETRNIVGGFISVDANPANPALRTLNLREDPGQDIGQRITTGWNLRQISKSTESQGIVTKVWALGRGEGVNQLRLSTDKLLGELVTFQAHAGARSTLTFTRDHCRYKGWVMAGAALPDGYEAGKDVRIRPMKVWRGAIDDTANWEQGTSERQLRSKANDYVPGGGPWTLDYVHADYLQADAQVATYGILANVYVNKNEENSAALHLEAMRYLDSVKSPRVSHEISVSDLARIYRSETFERFHLYDKVNVWDDALDITTKDRIVGLNYADIDDPGSLKITVSSIALADQTPRSVDVRDRVRKYEQQPDGATTLIGPDSFEDNVDATHPYTRYIEIPTSAVSVISVKLRMRTRPYRYYVATATMPDGGGSSTTTSSDSFSLGGADPSNSGGDTGHTHDGHSTDSTGSSAHTTDYQGEHTHTGGSVSSETDWTLPGHDHSATVPLDSALDYHVHTMGTTGTGVGHSHNVNTHSHGHSHSSHNSYQHAHTIGHQHNVPGHSHGVTIPAHNHSITVNPGIVESGTATQVQVVVDGTVASATATTLDDFDLIPYLSKNADGTIQRGYHTIVFTPNAVGRIQATITGLLFLQSRGAISG